MIFVVFLIAYIHLTLDSERFLILGKDWQTWLLSW